MYPLGVSIITVSYNGAKRLPETIKHIKEQVVDANIPWEVIMVDNASDDNTFEVMSNNGDITIPWKTLSQPRKGVVYARLLGIETAKYEFLLFVDDDNWMEPYWVQRVHEIFLAHPKIGMFAGYNEGVCEVPPPPWFEPYKVAYAIGSQGNGTSDITKSRGYVWGAGMAFRKSIYSLVKQCGFKPILTGGVGKKLSRGEDSELCYAYIAAGYQIWYFEDMKLRHYMPETRLRWTYIVALCRGFGESHFVFEIYSNAIIGDGSHVRRMYQNTILGFIPDLKWRIGKLFQNIEGDTRYLRYTASKHKFITLVKCIFIYNSLYKKTLALVNSLKETNSKNQI